MSNPAKLTFIIANGSSEVLPQLQDLALRSWLARAAGRGVLRRERHDTPDMQDHLPFERHLLTALGLRSQAKKLASASVCLAADAVTGFWLRAEPMHFAAGMTRIDAVKLNGAAELNDEDRRQLSVTIGDHLRASGLQWDAVRWLIGFSRVLDVHTREPNFAADLEDAMPSGADAKELRRLMTELQMVLHEHPVNVRRVRSGMPAANAVWVWGGGTKIADRGNFTSDLITTSDSFSSAKIFATDPFSLGLSFLTASRAITPENPEQVLSHASEDRVVVLDIKENSDLLEKWLRPLHAALAKGRLRSLIIAVDQWTVELTRTSFWLFWKQDVPIEKWSAA